MIRDQWKRWKSEKAMWIRKKCDGENISVGFCSFLPKKKEMSLNKGNWAETELTSPWCQIIGNLMCCKIFLTHWFLTKFSESYNECTVKKTLHHVSLLFPIDLDFTLVLIYILTSLHFYAHFIYKDFKVWTNKTKQNKNPNSE